MSAGAKTEAGPATAEIRAHLAEILESSQFRTSRRGQDLLVFMVEKVIEGRQDFLKERVIGVEVFKRSADYNPASDPIVRVSVADVRKRLAQYYQDAAPGNRAPRIRIATGHYVPEFSWIGAPPVEDAPSESTSKAKPRSWLRWAGLPIAAVLLSIIWIWTRPADPLEAFWGPAFHNRHSVLILAETYGPDSLMHRFNAELLKLADEPPPSLKLLEGDIAATFRQSVMSGNVFALRSLERLFSTRGQETEERIGGELSMADLAERPVVLIGYFNNPWAKIINNEQLRFTLVNEHRDNLFFHAIRDTRVPRRQWSISSDRPWFENTPISYAILTRVFDRHSGRFVVSIAGMTHLATSAATEFATSPAYLQELQRQAPSEWKNMNCQAVLQTHIVNQTAEPPKLLASHFW